MFLKIGSRGEDVKELQLALNVLGLNCGVADGIFGRGTAHQVEKFQESAHIHADGIVGRGTMRALNESLDDAGQKSYKFELGSHPDPVETLHKMKWVKVEADKVAGSGGYNRFYLREDAAEAYNAFRGDVLALGGVITSAGARRALHDSSKSKSRSTKSMHYTGLALDMALDSGMNNPKKEKYVIEEAGDRRWNVWCRTDNESVPKIKVSGYTYNHTRVMVEGRFFSITDLAEKHGWKPIRARSWFMRGGKFTGAEWWHFQWEDGLIKGKSTFGGELLKLYSLSECKEFTHWEDAKNCTFGVDWF